jgi:hypothetical protein
MELLTFHGRVGPRKRVAIFFPLPHTMRQRLGKRVKTHRRLDAIPNRSRDQTAISIADLDSSVARRGK